MKALDASKNRLFLLDNLARTQYEFDLLICCDEIQVGEGGVAVDDGLLELVFARFQHSYNSRRQVCKFSKIA